MIGVAVDKFRQRIKKVLVKHGALAEDRAMEAMALVESSGAASYSELLLEKGYIDEPNYLSAVSLETSLPPVDLDKVDFQPEALEAINAELANYYCVLPISKVGNILTVAVGNPFDILKLDDVRTLTNCDLRPVVVTERSIRRNIERAYLGEQKFVEQLESAVEAGMEENIELTKPVEDVVDVSQSFAEAGDAPVVKAVNAIVINALRSRASDIHIEPLEKRTRIRIRVDGMLREAPAPPRSMHDGLVSRVKILSNLDIAERRVPQDGKFQVRFENRQIDFRVSIMPTIYGEKVMLRVLDSASLELKISDLGLEPESEAAFRRAITASYGWVLVTGPTGSGKTTTLYAALRDILNIEENVVTVEDPVEYQMERVNQVPVNVKRGLTFAGALRSILRQDPDIIMIGEVRDLETADIAVKASITGHLVFSTLHTNDAASAITRLIDMGLDGFMVACSIIMIGAQRLVRKLCSLCKAPLDALPALDHLHQIGFRDEDLKDATLFRPVGCPSCNGGYRGRFAIMEALEMNRDIQRLIIEGKSAVDIKQFAMSQGMPTLRRSGCRAVARGITSIEEMLRNTLAD